jgi:hypothetical protein
LRSENYWVAQQNIDAISQLLRSLGVLLQAVSSTVLSAMKTAIFLRVYQQQLLSPWRAGQQGQVAQLVAVSYHLLKDQ